MRRYEGGGRVVYLDRRRWPSMAVFALALGFVASGVLVKCPCGLAERHWIPILGYALPLSLLAVGLLLRERTFVIHAGALEYVRRGLFGRVRTRSRAGLRDVRVSTSSAEDLGTSWIWIGMPGIGRVLFKGPLREGVAGEVERLSADLKA